MTPSKNSGTSENKSAIASMFSRIARRYDSANDLLSLGLHRLWKKKALKALDIQAKEKFLDLCCGTGDFLKRAKGGIGADLSFSMLEEAKKKLDHTFICADAESLPFKDQSLDKVIMGFGIRNIPDVAKALSEIYRVLRENGKLVILEFSRPRGRFFSSLYLFYLTRVLPHIGGWIAKDKSAYHYLAKTIQAFPDGEDFLMLMRKSLFQGLRLKRLSLGIASIYTGEK